MPSALQGYAAFGLLVGDESPELEQLLGDYNIVQVRRDEVEWGAQRVRLGGMRGDCLLPRCNQLPCNTQRATCLHNKQEACRRVGQ